eukprot:449043-Pyramimonas_sp.AAC.1
MPRNAHHFVVPQQPRLIITDDTRARRRVVSAPRSSAMVKHAAPKRVTLPPYGHLLARPHMVTYENLPSRSDVPRPPFQLQPQHLWRRRHDRQLSRPSVAARSGAPPQVARL